MQKSIIVNHESLIESLVQAIANVFPQPLGLLWYQKHLAGWKEKKDSIRKYEQRERKLQENFDVRLNRPRHSTCGISRVVVLSSSLLSRLLPNSDMQKS